MIEYEYARLRVYVYYIATTVFIYTFVAPTLDY